MDEAVRAILEARASRYAEAPAADEAGAEVGAYAGCRIGDVILGVPVSLVHEFAPLRNWTPLKGGGGLIGVTHVRGDVMALVDLLLGLCGRPSGSCEWMVVVEGRGGRAAALVSEVMGTRRVTASDLLPAEQSPSLGRGISAVTSDLWFLVDPAALAAALEVGLAEPSATREAAPPPAPPAPAPPPVTEDPPRKPARPRKARAAKKSTT